MNYENITPGPVRIGQIACRMVFGLGTFYAIITSLGLLSLQSPHDYIGNPYFTIMEVLSMLISLLMTLSLIAVHSYTELSDRIYSFTALILISFTTVITSCVHFTILSVSHTKDADQLQNFSFWFSFKWPSVVYALDILAWDWFFGLSMLFVAPIFKKGRLERNLRILLIICGLLSIIGLLGVPLHNMQIRNIGIIGYAVLGPVAFLLIGKTLGRQR